jgi:hypothetical protein
MDKSEKSAEDLVEFLTALRDEQATPHSLSLSEEEVTLTKELVSLAKAVDPDPHFVREVEKRLLALYKAEQRSTAPSLSNFVADLVLIWRLTMLKQKRFVYAIVVGIALMVSVFTVLPALAQFTLTHFAPREVEKLPFAGDAGTRSIESPEPYSSTSETLEERTDFTAKSESASLSIDPLISYSSDIKTLEGQAGFLVLWPRYVPPGCYFREGYYLDKPIAEIHLVYDSDNNQPCFDMIQRQADRIHRPFVGPGAVEEMDINGKAALYIGGVWVVNESLADRGTMSDRGLMITLSPEEKAKLFEGATWVEAGSQQLVFEHSGLLIRIQAGPSIPKEELVKIAESIE